MAGQTVHLVEEAGKAVLAFTQGSDLWVLTAEGKQAGKLVRRAAGQLTIRSQVR